MAISLDNIKKEADMLQTRLENGLINTRELKSFLVRVKAIPSPNGSVKRIPRTNERVIKAMEMLDRGQNKNANKH